MRMLRIIYEKTLKNKINKEKIREMTGLEKSEKFLRKQRLRCLGRVERLNEERGLVKELHLKVYWTKKGRPKKKRKEMLKCDMIARGLQRLDAQDHERWQLGSKNRLTHASGKHLLGSRNRRKHISGAKCNQIL